MAFEKIVRVKKVIAFYPGAALPPSTDVVQLVIF